MSAEAPAQNSSYTPAEHFKMTRMVEYSIMIIALRSEIVGIGLHLEERAEFPYTKKIPATRLCEDVIYAQLKAANIAHHRSMQAVKNEYRYLWYDSAKPE